MELINFALLGGALLQGIVISAALPVRYHQFRRLSKNAYRDLNALMLFTQRIAKIRSLDEGVEYGIATIAMRVGKRPSEVKVHNLSGLLSY